MQAVVVIIPGSDQVAKPKNIGISVDSGQLELAFELTHAVNCAFGWLEIHARSPLDLPSKFVRVC
jgi:hypothetical protein